MDLLKNYALVDLTHSLHEGVPTWSGGCGFRLEIKVDYEKGLRVQTIKSHAGVGTHMDAPSHFIPGGKDIGDLALENLFVPACVLDLRNKMDPSLFVLPQDIEDYEKRYGPIPKNSLVIARTGWEQFWTEPIRYRNPDTSGKMHFPGFSEEAAKLLLQKEIAGIGIDTLSPDGSNTDAFPVHECILGAGKYILENLAHLDRLPEAGAYALCLPPKLKDATESAVRVGALVPRNYSDTLDLSISY
jgi:kynurenine formamidase